MKESIAKKRKCCTVKGPYHLITTHITQAVRPLDTAYVSRYDELENR